MVRIVALGGKNRQFEVVITTTMQLGVLPHAQSHSARISIVGGP